MSATDSADCIRPATVQDVPAILNLVRKLAEYEKLSHMVAATEQDFQEALFPSKPGMNSLVEALLASVDGKPVGFALYFLNFSTFLGRPGIYLEDLFVEPEYRGRGFGVALLKRLARIAVKRGYGRVEWSVLTWNQPSIEFYERLGAERMEEWRTFRLTGDALKSLGS